MKNKFTLAHLLTFLQGFGLGAILTGFVADYNRKQLPLALIMLLISFFI